ncbi:MAG: hypothetical protein AAGH64_10195 [Planctomycetota bacterium]
MIGSLCVQGVMRTTRLIPLLVALLCAPVWAQDRDDTPIERALASVPADVDLCLSVSSASELRPTPAGRFVERAIRTFAGEDEGTIGRIVGSLGLPRDDAFDLLFGRQVILVMRSSAGGASAWAVRSEVSRSTLDTLRDALEPSPRDVVRGRPVHSVERGRFSLAFERSPFGATILLAPSTNDRLLREMLDAQPDGGLLERDVFPLSGRSLTDADALIFADLASLTRAAPGDTDAEPEPRWVALSAHANDSQISLAAKLTAPDIAGPAEIPFRPWASEWFDELSADALFLMLDRTNNELLSTLLGDAETGTPGLLPLRLPVEVQALATHRAAAVLRTGARGELEGALALETDDVRALADAIDAAMPALLPGGTPSFRGVPIAAIRSTNVPTPVPLLGKNGNANIAWNFRVCSDCNEDQETGWWSVGLGATTVSRLGRTLVSDVNEQETRADLPWLGMGLVRPSKLIALASDAGLRFGPEGDLFASVELLKWHEIRTGSDSSIAALTLVLTPSAPAGEPDAPSSIAVER